MRDYYEVLGIPKGSPLEEIKKAYRNLARQHHPDVDKSPGSEQRFKEINEAYQILSDPKKKEAYDRFGHAAFSRSAPEGGPSGASGSWGPFTYTYSTSGRPFDFSEAGFSDPFDIFESVFGFRDFRQAKKGKDLNFVLDIDFMEAVSGGERVVEVNNQTLHIKIPQGARTGTRVKFEGLGEEGPRKDGRALPAGDLYITLRVGSHPRFYREGDDIYSEERLTFSQLSLGDSVEVETVYGPVKLRIPPATAPGSEFRLKGKGIKTRHGQADHYVRVSLSLPKNLNREQRDLLERLKSLGL